LSLNARGVSRFAVIGWAVGLVGIWPTQADCRFVVTAVAAFGAIRFHTQLFEPLGAASRLIALAGVIVVAVAVALWLCATPSYRAAAAA
jgi:hypothetical protein